MEERLYLGIAPTTVKGPFCPLDPLVRHLSGGVITLETYFAGLKLTLQAERLQAPADPSLN